ncbi:uncharacterized protein N7511_002530 [Penicillium nucicola]|uniref:uncharacterized protein n=1 Tax=Penicillium nucicola TaxID=1850975 RepID=UPI0025453375|nr:uncharacterized protein N7511_002530 [Penicillium nucicola]KAJ5770479.1 hypothetical protein N7511_002530 [Penicillium nucicola]
MKPYIGIPLVFGLVYRAWSRKSLTPLGLVVAGCSASAHALHPWSAPVALLAVFYFGGTKVTKVKHEIKSRLTLSATGTEGGEGPRNHIQVLANSIVGTILSILHAIVLAKSTDTESCFSLGQNAADILMVGIVANYAAVAADTFSSELGILSKSKPRLITSLNFREVPPGTNGGVTATGLGAGLLGSFIVSLTSAAVLPFCSSAGIKERALWTVAMTFWGALGSVLDSVLGGLLQASVVDKRSGKVVEGSGGRKVLIHTVSSKRSTIDASHAEATGSAVNAASSCGSEEKVELQEETHESRRVETGHDWLDNNGVNIFMAASMSVGAMGIAQVTCTEIFVPSQLFLVYVSRATLALHREHLLRLLRQANTLTDHLMLQIAKMNQLQVEARPTGANMSIIRIKKPGIRLLPDIFRDEQDVPLQANGFIRREYMINGYAEEKFFATRLVLYYPENLSKFSGLAVVEPAGVSDRRQVWSKIKRWIMRNGDSTPS